MSDLIDKANRIVKKAVEWDVSREGLNDNVVARYADVPGLFEPFTWCPKGGDFQTMSTGMLPTLRMLSGARVDSDPLTRTPVVATPVLDDLAVGLRTVAASQFIAAALLKGCLDAEDAMWGEVANNIEQIADRTLSALDTMGDTGTNGFGVGLTVAAAVVTTDVVLPAGGALTAVAAAGSATTIAASATHLELSGESAPVVVDHMRDAIGTLKRQIVDSETRIATAARDMCALLEERRE